MIPAKTRLTLADYDALPESSQITELIDGEIVVNPPVDPHQMILGNVYFMLRSRMPSGHWRLAPTGLRPDEGSSLEPDLFWVSPQNTRCVLEASGRYWHGAPDLVVEILSPSTEMNDRGSKFAIYERAGVREYWMVNPEAQFVEVFILDADAGRYVRQGLTGTDGAFTSTLMGEQPITIAEWFRS